MRDRYEKQATIARRKSASKSGENSATTTPAAITTAASLSAIIFGLPLAMGTQWGEAIAGWFPDSFTGTSKWFQDRIGAWNARKGEGGFGKGERTVRRKGRMADAMGASNVGVYCAVAKQADLSAEVLRRPPANSPCLRARSDAALQCVVGAKDP